MKIVIDSKAWEDPRLEKFSTLCKNPHLAMGYLVAVWYGAMKEKKSLITHDDIRRWVGRAHKGVANKLMESGYLKPTDCGGFIVSGAQKRITKAVFFEKRATKAASKRWCENHATSNATSNATSIKKQVVSNEKDKALLKNKAQVENDLKTISKKVETKVQGVNKVIATYCEIFKQKFEKTPVVMGVQANHAKILTRDLGAEKACQYVKAYLSMNDSWFMKRDYSFSCLIENINKVGIFLEKGTVINGRTANQMELQSSNDSVIRKVLGRLQEESTNEAAEPW